MTSSPLDSAYSEAGVDIDAAQESKRRIKRLAASTFGPGVLSEIGLFGSLFEVKGFRKPILVSSVDGVGTKLKIAATLDRYDTVGVDLVNHCVNDILTTGAQPLFFLDYIAVGRLLPDKVEKLVQGLAAACRQVGCSLVGGETAEMPGIYSGSDFDLVGFIVGAVEKGKVLTGRDIVPGDVLLALPSSGLHTNGYSLARRAFDLDGSDARSRLLQSYPELGRSLGDVLLEPHRCYYSEIKPALPLVKGLAHITGGGLVDNIPRILPDGVSVRIDHKSWSAPPIFGMIQQRAKVTNTEMYRVFNMGVGMVIVASPGAGEELLGKLPGSWRIGEVVAGDRKVIVD
ncbi:MAG: phosphoribosylformylglycinamidine cyclo-ligase [Chloroflexi bacterium]|nr:phosphoribosylformylglycinamidine cyclo-ligase [Chloroflexota bacterium]